MQRSKPWIVVALLGACATGSSAPHRPPPNDLALATRQVAATWMRTHPSEQLRWSWGEGVLAYGLWRAQAKLDSPELRAYLHAYVRRHQAHHVRIAWSDDTTPGLTAAELVLAGDTDVRPVLERVVDYAMTAPRTPAQGLLRHLGHRIPGWLAPRRWLPDAWVDTLFHIPITLCRYTRLSGDPRYRDEAAEQLERYLRNMQDPASKLVTHAYNDLPRDERVPSFEARAFWARGNGWALVSLIEVLAELPASAPSRAALLVRARALAEALRQLQSADGLYHTVLLDPESYRETAASGLITYAFALGARTGLLDASFHEAAQRGMRGLLRVLVPHGDDLEVSGTSLGTNPSPRARSYARVRQADQVSYGVGAWLLAASALL